MIAAVKRLFGEGFRIFFLSAGLFGLLAMLVWVHWLGINALGGTVGHTTYAPPPHLWHAHEMIFGYTSAALGGFFLTAVPKWTGAQAAPHRFITGVWALWFFARLAVWFSGSTAPWLVAVVDLAFVPVLTARLLTQLLRRPKPQNMVLLLLLSLFWLGNLEIHLDWVGAGGPGAETGVQAGLFAACAMIAVLGGRITPAFTRNAMTRSGREDHLPRSLPISDRAGIGLAILLAVMTLLPGFDGLKASVALAAGAAQLVRLSGWRSAWTIRQPILWSMHLSFAALGVGYCVWGLGVLGWGSAVAGLHVLGIGAVGGMTVAVMSRAVLGHSGRPLSAPWPVALAYGLIPLAMAVRWAGTAMASAHYFTAMLISGVIWAAAMALFVVTLAPAMLGPRRSAG